MVAAECQLAQLAVTQRGPSVIAWFWRQPRRAAERPGLAGAVVTNLTHHVPLTEQEARGVWGRSEHRPADVGRKWPTPLDIHAGTLPGIRQC